MKRLKLIATFVIAFCSLTAQNWNVFNYVYRYNYIYNNNALITNVLFIDSAKINGIDTIYHMNRIGIECSGGCPTLTTSITGTVLVVNIPQFLQRKIIKYTNGLVMLKDTAKLILKPNCTLNETWLFDSVNIKNAQCIGINNQTTFSVTDSVKTILIDGIDTLKLSKNFGIIQFPDLYNKNKYYKLVGIENKSTYDQTALYGLKVPNDWDFYNFAVGDKFCYQNFQKLGSPNSINDKYNNRSVEIIAKTVIPNTGYSYTAIIKEDIKTAYAHNYFDPPIYNFSLTSNTTTLSYNTSTASLSNIMYPSQVIRTITYFDISHGQGIYPACSNLVKFGKDNFGKFYKYDGGNCQAYANPILPNNSITPNSYTNFYPSFPPPYIQPNYSFFVGSVFGEGLGMITSIYNVRYEYYECLTCAVKNGSLYLGEEFFVGTKENNKNGNTLSVYPNPVTRELFIDAKTNSIFKIELFNNLGQLILTNNTKEQIIKINLEGFTNGIYFLKTYSESGSYEIKKIVKE